MEDVPKQFEALDPLMQIELLRHQDFTRALTLLDKRISELQRSMLVIHALAPRSTLSMGDLAQQSGSRGFRFANLHYGRLGRMVAEQLGIDAPANWVQTIAYSDGNCNERGHFLWTLREPLIKALRHLGWFQTSSSADFAFKAAQTEMDADPQSASLSSTERQALVSARLGQGDYRKRMLDLWDHRCSVGDCALDCVLIASHALPWTHSTNAQRLDVYNGLLLSASIDRLFDGGLISFSAQGELLFKPELTPKDLASVGLTPNSRLRFVHAQHQPYLHRHRVLHGFETLPLLEKEDLHG